MASHIFTALIFLLAGFTQGFSGFGAALVAIPLLVVFMDVKTAVPLCVLNGLIITFFLTLRLRKHLDWQKILPLCLGALPGVYVGVILLKSASESLVRVLVGVMLIAYGIYRLVFQPKPKIIHSAWSYLAGFATGAISGAISAGGPPTIIYTTLTGWSKNQIKATLSGFFLVAGVMIALAHASSGITTAEVLQYFVSSAIFVIIGVVAGSTCYDRIGREAYIKFILIMLVFMGILMIGNAI